jgi:adenine deaminase
VNDNYRAVSDALALTRDEIVAIVRNGVGASLLTPAEKETTLAEIDRVLPKPPDSVLEDDPKKACPRT